MVNILSIECAGADISVAYFADNAMIAKDKKKGEIGYPQLLVPMVQKVMTEASYSFNDTDIFVSSAGAGSFTGVRIGLATVQGLALATNKKAAGVSNFTASAFMAKEKLNNEDQKSEFILSVIETRRQDFYVQLFKNTEDLSSITKPSAMEEKEILDTLISNIDIQHANVALCGDAALRLYRTLSELDSTKELLANVNALEGIVPDAETIGLYALNNIESLDLPIPLYVSEAHVSIKS